MEVTRRTSGGPGHAGQAGEERNAPVTTDRKLEGRLAGCHAQQCVPELVVSKDAVLVTVRVSRPVVGWVVDEHPVHVVTVQVKEAHCLLPAGSQWQAQPQTCVLCCLIQLVTLAIQIPDKPRGPFSNMFAKSEPNVL